MLLKSLEFLEGPVAGLRFKVGVLLALDCLLVFFGLNYVLEVFPGSVLVEAELACGPVSFEVLDLAFEAERHGLFLHKL